MVIKTIHPYDGLEALEVPPRPDFIGDDWIAKFTDYSAGIVYEDPSNKGTYVRAMPGRPFMPLRWQTHPHYVYFKDGAPFNPDRDYEESSKADEIQSKKEALSAEGLTYKDADASLLYYIGLVSPFYSWEHLRHVLSFAPTPELFNFCDCMCDIRLIMDYLLSRTGRLAISEKNKKRMQRFYDLLLRAREDNAISDDELKWRYRRKLIRSGRAVLKGLHFPLLFSHQLKETFKKLSDSDYQETHWRNGGEADIYSTNLPVALIYIEHALWGTQYYLKMRRKLSLRRSQIRILKKLNKKLAHFPYRKVNLFHPEELVKIKKWQKICAIANKASQQFHATAAW